jgi:hypothetical protein
MYTVTDLELNQVDELTNHVNKMVLERDIVEANTMFGDSYFAKLDTSKVGLPTKRVSRWDQKMTQNIFSVFKVVAKCPSQIDPERNYRETLLTIQYFGNGNFSMRPDFTHGCERHEIELGDETYLYIIENKSEQLSKQHEAKEQMIFEEFLKRLQENRKERLPYPIFDPVPQDYLQRYSVFGEFISAQEFGADMIYLEYLAHIPEEWKPDPQVPNQLLSAKSQVSLASPIPHSNSLISMLGIPFEFHLITSKIDTVPPSIYFKIKSVDIWDRHTVIGYGFIKLPIAAQREEIEIKCWKPTLHFQSRLKNFFVGGCPDIQDLKFNEFDVPKYNLGENSKKSLRV